jgi:hypothetical protein
MRCAACNNLRQIYYRDLCQRCYFKSSKLKRATKCQHAGIRPHYSKGKCRECYLMCYYQSRKKKNEQKSEGNEGERSEINNQNSMVSPTALRQQIETKLQGKQVKYSDDKDEDEDMVAD